MKIVFLSIFPHLIRPYFEDSIMKRAQAIGFAEFMYVDIRDFAEDKHKRVDDVPYGGGPGMVMKADVIVRALEAVVSGTRSAKFTTHQKFKIQNAKDGLNAKGPRSRVVLLDARGEKFTHRKAEEYAQLDNLVLICGRYEGVDERVLTVVDEQISVGDYVVTGGELPAAIVADATVRLIPGVLGDDASLEDESHSEEGVVEYPQYTRPEKIIINSKEYAVPEVLLSGNHAEIAKWRQTMQKRRRT